jgi:L,D-transpeptidase YcbB
MLNATKFSWIDRIDANLERWRWLPNTLPETMLRVNIAAFVLRGIQQGEETLLMNVIVGRPYRNTPVFSETLKYMVLNPFWNVPFKLATEDKLTILQKNPQQLMSLGYEAKMNGGDQFLPVDAIDWSGVTRRNFNYLLRQRPGPANALGRIKFMLPNPFSVYLHDTPDRQLFNKQERGFSSGCVRLAQPVVLAQWLLNNDGRPQEAATIESLIQAGDTMAINLNKPVPVFIVYFTAFTNTDGDVVFRRDLYQRDAPVIAALRGGG